MEARWIDTPLVYDGSQLASQWAYRTLGIAGDSIIAFRGGCDIPPEKIVDLEDLLAGARIFSRLMVHFIVEHFDRDLHRAVLRQRLLACIAGETVHELAGIEPKRQGDDLFLGERKLSISIATTSPVSTLVHFGVNVTGEGAPVPAAGLEEVGVEGEAFARRVMDGYRAEMEEVARACCKVRGVP